MNKRFCRIVILFALAGFNLVAQAAPSCNSITLAPSATLEPATAGTAYGPVAFSASGSLGPPYSYDISSGLPVGSGLSINASSGQFSGTPTTAGNFLMTVTASDTNGCTGGRTYALDVGVGNQTITFTSVPPGTAAVNGPAYNVSATATSGLPVAFSIDATATSVCSISGSTVSFLTAGSCVIDADQAGNASFNAAPQVKQTFAVGKGNQTITFTSVPPGNPSVGAPTYNVTATATSSLPVTFSIDATATSVCSIAGSTVSFIGSGTCIIDADQAGDVNWNAAPQASQSFGVALTAQTITFSSTAPVGSTVGGATYNVTATASSGLAVTLTIDATATSICSLPGSTVSFIGAGNCVIDANQAGNGTYAAAPQKQQSFLVGKGDQTISFTSTAPAAAVVGGPTYTAIATATSGLAVTFTINASSASVCSIAGSTVSFIGAGTCVIDADQAGNVNYNAAPQVPQSFSVGPGNQTISFTTSAPPGATVGSQYTPLATATSGLPVNITIDGTTTSICSISGGVVTFNAAGTCLIDADQGGNANYNPAPQAQQPVTIGKANQAISFTSTAPAAAAVDGPSYTVMATGGASLNPVVFTIDGTSASGCSIAGAVVTFHAPIGTCVIDANQLGDANYNPAPQVQQSFSVDVGDQTITFASTVPAAATVGGTAYHVTATASSGLTVTFTIDSATTSVCTIDASDNVSFTAVGTCQVNADQAGDSNYNAAPQVNQSFAVGKGNQTITISSTAPASAKVGGPTYAFVATASSGLPLALSIDPGSTTVCSITGSTVSFIGVGTCKVLADQAGNTNWNPAPQVFQSFAVAIGDQTTSFTSTAPVGETVGGPTYVVTATASSGLPVALTIDVTATSVCSLSGNTSGSSVSFIGSGTCKIDADQAGSVNYNAAPQANQSFSVAKADQTIGFTSTAPVNAKVAAAGYVVTATASSGLPVALTIDASATAVCSISGSTSGSTVSFIGAGTCQIDANQAGDGNFNAAPQALQSFLVAKGDQTVSFTSTAPVGAKVAGPAYTVTATASSGLPVTLSIDATATSICSISGSTSGSTVSFTAFGACVIDVNQAGSVNYNAATQVQQTFSVAKGDQTVSFTSTAPVGAKVAGAGYVVTATATSGLPVTLTIDATATGVCSLSSSTSGSTVSFTGAGSCVIDADQAGNANYNAAAQVKQTFAVAKGDQTITFASTAPVKVKPGDAGYVVTATASSGLPVVLTIAAASTGICSISGSTSGSTVTYTADGTCTINANQAGNTNYNAAPQVQQSILVDAPPTVTSSVPTNSAMNVALNSTITINFSKSAATTGTPFLLSCTPGAAPSFTVTPASPATSYVLHPTTNLPFDSVCTVTVDHTVVSSINNTFMAADYMFSFAVKPVAVSDTYPETLVGNVSADSSLIPYSVTTNDQFHTAVTISAFDATSANGGTISMTTSGAGVGRFTYNPPAGFTGTDTFTYTINNANGSSTATASIPVSGIIWFINNNAPAGDGRLSSPFNTLAAFQAVNNGTGLHPAANANIFLYDSVTGYTGPTTLLNGQKLIGQDATTGLASIAGVAMGTSQAPLPGTGGGSPNKVSITATGNTVTLGSGNTVNGLTLGNATGTALIGSANVGTFAMVDVAVTNSTGPGIALTAGGTVAATGINTIATTTSTALNVANTNIASGGMTFRSISAGTAASGPTNGIVLNNTGSAGGLVVSGTGSAGSGGTIQKTTGNGIALISTANVHLSWMNVASCASDGINGASVNGLSLTNVSVTNSGASANHQGVKMTELQGSATLTNTTVTGSTANNVWVDNTSATLASLSVSGGTFGSTNNAFATADNGFLTVIHGTATLTNATISGSTFSSNFASGLQVQAGDTATIGNFQVSGSTFTNNGNTATDFDQFGGGNITFHMLNNTSITGNVGPTINVFSSSTASGGTLKGRIDGNHVGNAAVTGSGSTGGPGIRVFLQGKTVGTLTIVNNVVRQTPGSRGIDVETLGPVATGQPVTVSDITIVNNDVNNNDTTGFALDDIYIAADNQGSPAEVRAEVHGNTIKSGPGCADYPGFSGNEPWMYYNIAAAGAVAQLVNFGGHANANTEISATQTSGTAGANAGVTLIAGPINTVP